jgi:hypothetical protein
MRRASATIEWQIVQDEQTWRQLVQASTPPNLKRRHLSTRLGEALLLFGLLGVVSFSCWYITQSSWQQTQTELAAVVQQEKAASLSIRLLARQGDRAIVSAPTVGQTRFYQRTATGWQQRTPSAEDWGPPEQLATPSFHWYYQAQDAPVVATVAAQIESLSRTLHQNLGLSVLAMGEKVTIEVSLSASTEQRGAYWVALRRLHVPAPVVYRTAVDLSDADVLAQSIALPLINQAIDQAQKQYGLASTWQPLLEGLRLWQVWDTTLPLATWRRPVVQWLYQALPSATEGAVVLPQGYSELCNEHQLWLTSPMQVGIPLLCTALDKEPWYVAIWGTSTPLRHLNQFTVPVTKRSALSDRPLPEGQAPRGQTIALATLIDYAVVTYGRERLPALVAGLGQSESWETLLPAVYGVSAAEFDAGWQRYLARQYIKQRQSFSRAGLMTMPAVESPQSKRYD